MAVIAYLLPGPATAHVDMGSALYNALPDVRSMVDQADKFFKAQKMEYKASKACFLGPEEMLRYSSYAGPALLSLCWGISQALRAKHVMPAMVGGAGYGEVLGLVVARALDFQDALMYLLGRGELLEAAWAKNPYHVVTITGMPVEKLQTIVDNLKPKPLIVGYHSPDACTVAGVEGLLKKLAEVLKNNKTYKVRTGEVVEGVDWPHPVLEEASKEVGELFQGLKLERAGTVEMYSSVTGDWIRDHNTLPELARRGCVEPVRFDGMIRAMRGRGMDTVVEIGPVTALGAYTHTIDAGVRVLATEGIKDFASTVKLAN